MAENSPIEWTDHTWSPWEGCTKVGPGCDHCYAEGMNRWLRKGENWGPGAPRREYSDAHWEKPLRWNAAAAKAGKRVRVFPSVCDPFDNEAPREWRLELFNLIEQTPNLDWLLLTKRIGNAASMMADVGHSFPAATLPHVWLGATVVNQEEADRDIPKLLSTPARVRFLSMEPLLGPVELKLMQRSYGFPKHISREGRCFGMPQGLHWVIAGGESGRGARPSHPDWFRSLRDQCARAGVPFLFKQWGEWKDVGEHAASPRAVPGNMCRVETPGRAGHYVAVTMDRQRSLILSKVGKKAAGRLLDGVTHDGMPKP